MDSKQVLAIFKQTKALLSGHFILSSGLHSGQYLQCAQVLQYPEQAQALGRALADKFSSDKVDAVISPALGGMVIGYETARALGVRFIFTERKEGVQQLRRGFKINPGERLLIVEDVVTTGGSSKEVAKIVKDYQGEIAGFAAVADRSGSPLDFEEKFEVLLKIDIPAFKPEDCLLCKNNIPLIKPGSRTKT